MFQLIGIAQFWQATYLVGFGGLADGQQLPKFDVICNI